MDSKTSKLLEYISKRSVGNAMVCVASNAIQKVFETRARKQIAAALADDLAPLRQLIRDLEQELISEDTETRMGALAKMQATLPDVYKKLRERTKMDDKLLDALTSAAVNGIESSRIDTSNALFTEPSGSALDYLKQKTSIPTTLKTWMLDALPAELRERMAFSAAVTKVEFVDSAYSAIEALVKGTADRATMRLELKRELARLGYTPEKAIAGTLKDLSSDERLNLILDTNLAQAQSYAWHQAGQQEDLLDAFPAQEFLRVESRTKPRDNWKARWDAARAATKAEGATSARSGRMVALKNHPIWVKLSRFGTPYEPFDFNSGMGVEDVDRREAMQLGLIDLNTRIEPDKTGLNTALQASPTLTDDQLRKALEATGIGRFDSAGVFNLIRKGKG